MKLIVAVVGGAVVAAVVVPLMLLAALLSTPSALAGSSPGALAGSPAGSDDFGLGPPSAGVRAPPPRQGVSEIPEKMLVLYVGAARICPGLSWTVLAGIGKVETDHGRGAQVSPAGAEGPMQFMPATWARYGIDGDGDGIASVWDAADAVASAANYLCANGAGDPERLASAIFQYNHDAGYVRTVLALADRYAWLASEPPR